MDTHNDIKINLLESIENCINIVYYNDKIVNLLIYASKRLKIMVLIINKHIELSTLDNDDIQTTSPSFFKKKLGQQHHEKLTSRADFFFNKANIETLKQTKDDILGLHVSILNIIENMENIKYAFLETNLSSNLCYNKPNNIGHDVSDNNAPYELIISDEKVIILKENIESLRTFILPIIYGETQNAAWSSLHEETVNNFSKIIKNVQLNKLYTLSIMMYEFLIFHEMIMCLCTHDLIFFYNARKNMIEEKIHTTEEVVKKKPNEEDVLNNDVESIIRESILNSIFSFKRSDFNLESKFQKEIENFIKEQNLITKSNSIIYKNQDIDTKKDLFSISNNEFDFDCDNCCWGLFFRLFKFNS